MHSLRGWTTPYSITLPFAFFLFQLLLDRTHTPSMIYFYGLISPFRFIPVCLLRFVLQVEEAHGPANRNE